MIKLHLPMIFDLGNLHWLDLTDHESECSVRGYRRCLTGKKSDYGVKDQFPTIYNICPDLHPVEVPNPREFDQ